MFRKGNIFHTVIAMLAITALNVQASDTLLLGGFDGTNAPDAPKQSPGLEGLDVVLTINVTGNKPRHYSQMQSTSWGTADLDPKAYTTGDNQDLAVVQSPTDTPWTFSLEVTNNSGFDVALGKIHYLTKKDSNRRSFDGPTEQKLTYTSGDLEDADGSHSGMMDLADGAGTPYDIDLKKFLKDVTLAGNGETAVFTWSHGEPVNPDGSTTVRIDNLALSGTIVGATSAPQRPSTVRPVVVAPPETLLLGGFDGSNAVNEPNQHISVEGNVAMNLSTVSPMSLGFNPGEYMKNASIGWGTTKLEPDADDSNTKAVLFVNEPLTLFMTISNISKDKVVELERLHWISEREGGEGTSSVSITYASGGLSDKPGTKQTVDLGAKSFAGHDYDLSGLLEDRKLAPGEEATFSMVVPAGNGLRFRMDNLAFSGRLLPLGPGDDPATVASSNPDTRAAGSSLTGKSSDPDAPLAFNVNFLHADQEDVTGLHGVVGGPGETWNRGSKSVSDLVDSNGKVTSSISVTGLSDTGRKRPTKRGLSIFSGSCRQFPKGYDMTINIQGLEPGSAYDIYIYSLSNAAYSWGDSNSSERSHGEFVTENVVQGNGRVQSLDNGLDGINDENFVVNGNYVVFESIIADDSGNITIVADAYDGADGDETNNDGDCRLHVNGLQIRPAGQMNGDYIAWREAEYPDLGPPNVDVDRDGLTNDQERIFGLDPTDPASANPFVANLEEEPGTFTYTRRAQSLTSLNYSVWYTTGNNQWSRDSGATQILGSSSNGIETIIVRINPSLLSHPELSVQIRAEE